MPDATQDVICMLVDEDICALLARAMKEADKIENAEEKQAARDTAYNKYAPVQTTALSSARNQPYPTA